MIFKKEPAAPDAPETASAALPEEETVQTREEALAERERELARRELRAAAQDRLDERKLPRELLDTLDYSSAESCLTSMDSVEKAFRAAVREGITRQLRVSPPALTRPRPDLDRLSDQEYYSALRAGKA